MNAQCSYIAMGSNEGVATADKAIANAAASGSWVLIKNVHLAPVWLQSLEKRLGSLKPHPEFRVFPFHGDQSKDTGQLVKSFESAHVRTTSRSTGKHEGLAVYLVCTGNSATKRESTFVRAALILACCDPRTLALCAGLRMERLLGVQRQRRKIALIVLQIE